MPTFYCRATMLVQLEAPCQEGAAALLAFIVHQFRDCGMDGERFRVKIVPDWSDPSAPMTPQVEDVEIRVWEKPCAKPANS